MTAKCQLCGVSVQSHYVPDDPANPAQQLIEYDRLSAYMWLHLSENHPNQVQEGILVQQRAAKLYAMNWADASADTLDIRNGGTIDLDLVRQEWRRNLIFAMSQTTASMDDFGKQPTPQIPELPKN